jgi:serine/threonine-protein kinase
MPEHPYLAQALAEHYTIDRELGRGGFATVFLAQDRRHDRPVALKVLHPEIAASLGADRFKQEIRLAARLQHPHILSVHDSGEANGQLWFTMPFVEGESLRDRLNRERQLPVAEAVRIAREIAGALDYAHRHGVVHRDIKPENILMSDGHALVADFGIARALEGGAVTQTGMVIGTPTYMSPEQAGGAAVDARTDVYSLGAMLYEMLVGEPPFTGPTTAVILGRVMTETPRPIRNTRPSTPAALEAIVNRALARLPADRFSTAADFAAALDVPLGESGITPQIGPPITQPTAVTSAPARTRSWWPIAAVIGLLVAVGGGYAWYSSSSSTSGGKRLAVLPFENLGASEDEYFADGMTDEVRGKLAALPGLQVTARSSAAQYKKANGKTPQQIGRELGVDYLLTGTVRWQASGAGHRRVRVSPELIRVTDGTARWQEPFETELSDVFSVQSDIASRVAQALDVALGTSAKQQLQERPTGNVAAYEAFLRGEQESQSLTLSDAVPLRKAVESYEQAVGLDPSFAQAWAQLSRAACRIAASTPTPADADRCRIGAEKAVALAPNRALSRLAKGYSIRSLDRDLGKALDQYALGLQSAPNDAELLAASAAIERSLGRFDEGLAHLQRAASLDPRSVSAASGLARAYHDVHRHAEAQVEYDRALALAPANLSVFQAKAGDFLSQGDLAGARAVVATAVQRTNVTAVIVRFATFQEMMWVLPDDLRSKVVDLQASNFDNDRAMWALKVGATYRLMGDPAKSKSWGETSAAAYKDIAARYPDDPQQQELYGRALALAGKSNEAMQAGERSLSLRATSLDALNGPYYKYQVARIYIQAGQYEKAMDLIEPLLSQPGDLTPGWLRIDPIFSPLRGNPRFDRLIK